MKEFPKGGLIGKVMDAAKTVKQMHIPLHAAYAAYFIILAFFPALVLILSVLRYTGMEVRGLVELLGDILPSTMVGDAEELIYSTYRNSSGALVGVSAVTALWAASRVDYHIYHKLAWPLLALSLVLLVVAIVVELLVLNVIRARTRKKEA